MPQIVVFISNAIISQNDIIRDTIELQTCKNIFYRKRQKQQVEASGNSVDGLKAANKKRDVKEDAYYEAVSRGLSTSDCFSCKEIVKIQT